MGGGDFRDDVRAHNARFTMSRLVHMRVRRICQLHVIVSKVCELYICRVSRLYRCSVGKLIGYTTKRHSSVKTVN